MNLSVGMVPIDLQVAIEQGVTREGWVSMTQEGGRDEIK